MMKGHTMNDRNEHLTVDQYAAALVAEGLADSTVKIYRCMLLRFMDHATTADRDAWQPDAITVRSWANVLPKGSSTRHQARAAIKHWCRMLDTPDVSGAIRVPRAPRVPRSRALTDDQVRRLLPVAERSGLAGLAVIIGLFTGARRSEIASLEWDNIDLSQRRITLVRTKVSDTHDVAVCDYLHRMLEVRQVPGEQWLFPGRYGGHVAPAVVWEMITGVAKAAGIGHVTPHQLRHTIIGAVYDIGRDPFAAQRLAGHVDPSQTSRYSHRSHRAIVDALEAATARWTQDDGPDDGVPAAA